jgi:DNA-binding CsgD family transcriptional regulator/tetratricopeptide (TPR) repeat protein
VTSRLLERGRELEIVREAIRAASVRRGSVVLVAGEAGIGKTSLVRLVADQPGTDARTVVGTCDDFLTSRTLGPFHDVARSMGGPLAEAVAAADTGAVCDVLLAQLDDPLRPTMLILEDVHWADEATLDVVRYVGRRLERMPAVLVLTYRDDEVDPDHPLTGVLGVLPSHLVHRIRLHPLSRQAVTTLTAGTDLDPDAVLASTAGNPFFVTEVLLGGEGVPASVAGAVLARVRTLPSPTRQAIGLLAVLPRPTPLSEIDELLGDPTVLAPAEQRGLLTVERGAIGFRHELARQAVLAALPASTRTSHHESVLTHLLRADRDPAAILHHAVEADRGDLIVQYGPAIAHEAYRAGAQRQALGHQRHLLQHAQLLPPAEHAELLEEHAWSLYNLHDFDAAATAADAALTERRQLADPDRIVTALLVRSRMLYMVNQPLEARRALDEAETLGSGSVRAETAAEVAVQRLALSHLLDDHATVVERSTTTQDLIAQVDRPDLDVLARSYVGASTILLGDAEGGLQAMSSALDRGHEAGALEPVARVYVNLVEHLLLLRRWSKMREVSEEAIRFYDDHDFRAHRFNTVGQQARLRLYLGDWDEAESALRRQVTTVGEAGVLAVIALESLALLAVRRGRDDAEELLERAWEAALASASAQYIVPVACAGIELAWLRDEHAAAERFIGPGLDAAGTALLRAWLQWRLPLVGRHGDPTGLHLEPERRSLSSDPSGAAAAWQELEMPYEQALELERSGRPEALLEAVAILDLLGAEPAARLVRRRLRDVGVRSIPRGPRPATRRNPAGLTGRQLEVLELVAAGLTNAQIADRLVVSNRTVDHHVSAVLQKLGAASRQEATERGRDLGVLG